MFESNSASHGGAIYQEGSNAVSNIFDTSFTYNQATETDSQGGAIAILGGVLNIKDSSFEGNTADYGGAIYNVARTVITNTDFTENAANISCGAIYNAADAILGIIADGKNVSVTGKILGEEEDISNAIYNAGQLELINTGVDNKTLTISETSGSYTGYSYKDPNGRNATTKRPSKRLSKEERSIRLDTRAVSS